MSTETTSQTPTCDAETWDGNRDDPEYAYCGLPAGHGGEHGNWRK